MTGHWVWGGGVLSFFIYSTKIFLRVLFACFLKFRIFEIIFISFLFLQGLFYELVFFFLIVADLSNYFMLKFQNSRSSKQGLMGAHTRFLRCGGPQGHILIECSATELHPPEHRIAFQSQHPVKHAQCFSIFYDHCSQKWHFLTSTPCAG